MDEARIATGLWVEAQLRQLNQKAISYYIANKGAYFSGAVVIKLNTLDGFCQVLTQIRDENAQIAWMAALKGEGGDGWVAESDADSYIRRAVDRDPDIWVIEIEDRSRTNPFEGKIIL